MVQHLSSEALVVHGGGLTSEEQLTEKAAQRMDTAISAWQQEAAPNMVVSGGYSFTLRQPPSITEASAMKSYALVNNVPEGNIFTEEQSLDTVGNALFTKTDIVIPKGWEHLIVVTSESHLPRALDIFHHVYGSDFEIKGIPAPEQEGLRERVWELLGTVLVREVLRGTKAGDHEAIRERLFDLVPGYADGTFPHLAASLATGLVRRK